METRSNHVLVGAVTLALLAGLLIFAVWVAGVSSGAKRCYDIYFNQGVAGLNRGSNVTYAGVPVGQIDRISLDRNNPQFVKVRIDIDEETPVLRGTEAKISGVGFTGVSEIQLEGAIQGAGEITEGLDDGCADIPAGTGGLSAVLNSAPELLDRIQRLTERLTELLSDENQNSISDILENVEKSTAVLAARAPDLADAVADARTAAREAGIAAERWGQVAATTDGILKDSAGPAMQEMQQAIASIEAAARQLDGAVADARPGLQNFSKSTLPEADRLVRDLRQLTDSLDDFTTRLNEDGIGGALKPQQLPDYKPGKKN